MARARPRANSGKADIEGDSESEQDRARRTSLYRPRCTYEQRRCLSTLDRELEAWHVAPLWHDGARQVERAHHIKLEACLLCHYL